MASSLNKCAFIGNLGKDPESRSTQSGTKIVNFSIACTESWKDQSGEKKERTEWVRLAVMGGGLADVVERYLQKGSKVYVEGKMQTRKWTDRSGQEKYTTEIVVRDLVMLDSKRDGAGASDRDGAAAWDAGNGRQAASNGGGRGPKSDFAPAGAFKRGADPDLDDAIPF